jgi:hypothetical protein
MLDWQLKTPVVFIIFKRPDTTKKVFEVIRQAKPPKLFVIADGPRPEKPDEVEKCVTTRAIVKQIDWDCEVLENYSDVNQGCQQRVSSGLDWVFNTVEKAIILEDDCLPHPTFFRYCEELLHRYSSDKRIMSISGRNEQFSAARTDYSYHFSLYNSCWGWATWRRAWKYYDFDMKIWPEICTKDWLEDLLVDSHAVKFWTKTFQSVYDGSFNTWAYRWKFACWVQNSLSIIPSTNLISNIGFGEEATNTKYSIKKRAMLPLEEIVFPLQHPSFIIRDTQSERAIQKNVYNQSLLLRTKAKVKKIIGK